MKILLGNAEFGMTGAAIGLLRLGTHLVKSGHQVSALPGREDTGALLEDYRNAGIVLIDPDRVAAESWQVVLCNGIMSAALVLGCAPEVTVIWWIQEGEIGLQLAKQDARFAAAFQRTDLFIFATPVMPQRIYASYLTDVPPHRIMSEFQGFDPPAAGEVPQPRRDPSLIRVVSVGSIYPRKRHPDLIEAVRRLGDLPLECVLVGRFHSLPRAASETLKTFPDRYVLTGELSIAETMRWVAGSDIYVLPSESEAFGIANLEAGIRRLPLILSDLPCYEGIWKHGVDCLIYQPGDVDLLTHFLRMLASDAGLRQRFGTAAEPTAKRWVNTLLFQRLDAYLGSIV
jgi:glycosyltransferase involved in cell wall biosynthesis